jgi:hypothetical protein
MLMPGLLLGLLAISIPILVHLLHRQQTQPVQWGAMQFLRTSQLRKKQRKKVDHWLLMLMRVLAIAVLAFLLARPRMPGGMFASHGITESPADVAVIIDHSLSTGRMSDGKTVFDRSRMQANNLLEQLAANDTFSIILAEHRARPLNAQPIKKNDQATIGQLRDQLAQQPPGMTDCSIPEAISTARRLLANGRNPTKAIVIFSDQQRANWHIRDDALWRAAIGDHMTTDLPIHSFPIAPDADFSNVSVSALNIQPTIIGINRPVQITAQVANTGTKPMTGMVAQLLVNGKQIDTKPVTPLAPKSSATIRFDIDAGLQIDGSNWVKVAVNAADDLAADNSAVAVANVLKSIPVLVIDGQFSDAGDFKSSQFLQAAMQPVDPSLIHASIVSVSQANAAHLEDFTVVVLNDLPGLPTALRDHLADYVRSGHGLWIILGPKSPRAMIEQDLAANGLFIASVNQVVNSTNAPSGIEVKDPSNPVVHIITDNLQNALTGAEARKWWSLTPTDAQTILSATNGDPLVMEHAVGSSGGIVDIWASGVDGSWNNWNLMPNFVPLVNETIYHLATPALHGLENRGLDAGQPIEWAGPAKPAVTSVQITLPDGTTTNRPATFNNGRWIFTDPDTYPPGIYKLAFTPADIPPACYGVNIDRSELDPAALDTDDVNWLKHAGYLDPALPVITESDLPNIITRKGQPSEMWGLLGGVLLASLLVETFLTYRLIRSQKRVTRVAAGLPAAHAGV